MPKPNSTFTPEEKKIILENILEMLKEQFPDKNMLDINDTAKAYGFKNPQSIYNSLRKNAPNPLPVKPIKRCGRWYWNIVKIAEDMAS